MLTAAGKDVLALAGGVGADLSSHHRTAEPYDFETVRDRHEGDVQPARPVSCLDARECWSGSSVACLRPLTMGSR